MDISSAANSWVDSYLEALISSGSRDSLAARTGAAAGSYFVPEAVDADRQVCARYYVNQILGLDEDALRKSWNKVQRANRDSPLERDARIEYLSWRVWAMKRKRAALAALRAARAARAAARRRAASLEAGAAEGGEGEGEGGEDEDDGGEAEGEVESDDRGTLAYLDELDTATASLEPLTEEVDLADPAAAAGLPLGSHGTLHEPEPLSPDQPAVPDMEQPEEQSWDAVAPIKQATMARTGRGTKALDAASGASVKGGDAGTAVSVLSPSAFSLPTSAGATTARLSAGRHSSGSATGSATAAAAAAASSPSAAGPIAPSPPSSRAAHAATPSILGPHHAPSSPAPSAFAPSSAHATAATTAIPTATTAAHVGPPTEADLALLVNRQPRLYVVLISLHGLVRGTKMELGRDPDTGGQVKYVVELARALGRVPSVARVDLLTRLIADPKVDASYSVPQERLDGGGPPSPGASAGGAPPGEAPEDPEGAFIVRLPCGPSEAYLKKEDLWPHVREFADHALRHVASTLGSLARTGSPAQLWGIHGHYADAGEAAALLASSLGAPMLMTGHSLGRNKKAHLLASGSVSLAEVEATYRISRRIEAEERALDAATAVFTSTQQEVKEQWGLYDGYREQLAAALSQRRVPGLQAPSMVVIPPGLDFSALKVSLPPDPLAALLEAHAASRPRGPGAPAGSTLVSRQVSRRGTPFLSRRTSLDGATAPGPGPTAATPPTAGPAVSLCAALGIEEAISAIATPGPGPAPKVPSSASTSSLQAAGQGTVTFQASPMNSAPVGSGGSTGGGLGSAADAASASDPGVKISLLPPASTSEPVAPITTPAPREPRAIRAIRTSTPGSASGHPALPTPDRTPPRSPFAGPPSPIRRGLLGPFNDAAAAAAAALGNGGGGANGGLASPPSGSGVVNAPPASASALALPPPQQSVVFTEPPIWREVHRFLRNPAKPVILAMSRPDAKKNVTALIRAYGSSAVLRDLANLVLVLGNRDQIDGMASGSARVMESVLKLVDAYDLYGSVAYPKRHAQSDISDIYHIAAATRGVFVNVALQEPFGLTLIEAAAHGVPIVATCHGGPVDIVATLRNGVTVEPGDVGAIAGAVTEIITRPELWDTYSNNGRTNILAYSWPSHVLSYLRAVEARRATDPDVAGDLAGTGPLGALATGGAVGAPATPGGPAGGGASGAATGPVGAAGCHGSPGTVGLRAAFSLSYDDLNHLTRAAGDQVRHLDHDLVRRSCRTPLYDVSTCISAPTSVRFPAASASPPAGHSSGGGASGGGSGAGSGSGANSGSGAALGLPALGEALSQLAAGRAASLQFELSPAMVAAAAAGLDADKAAAVAAAASDLLRGADGAASGGGGGGGRRGSISFDANDPTAAATLKLFGDGGGAISGGGVQELLPPPPAQSAGPELFPGASLTLQARLSPAEAAGRWVVFVADDAADLARAAAALAALAEARRQAAAAGARTLGEVLTALGDGQLSALVRHALGLPPSPASDPIDADPSATALLALPASALGLGVVSCLGCSDTRSGLAGGGLSLSDLDFMACNNAAQLWLTGAKAAVVQPAQRGSSGGGVGSPGTTVSGAAPEVGCGGAGGGGGSGGAALELLFDEGWERHMERRWEPTAAKQVVRRILSNRSGWGRLPLGRPGFPPPRISALGPYHVMATFTPPSVAAAADLAPAVLLSRFRRKLRLSGLRAQTVVTPPLGPAAAGRAHSIGLPAALMGLLGRAGSVAAGLLGRASSLAGGAAAAGGSGLAGATSAELEALAAMDSSASGGGAAGGGGGSAANGGLTLHIVPLRCSRALVLRYLSCKYGIPLEHVTVAAFHAGGAAAPAAATAAGEVVVRCSDGEDLVAGLQRVALLPPLTAASAAAAAGLPAFKVDLAPYKSSGRVVVL